jgi:hypothetical protein
MLGQHPEMEVDPTTPPQDFRLHDGRLFRAAAFSAGRAFGGHHLRDGLCQKRRRKWTAQEKAALPAEVEAEGGKVTVVARPHRISESVLYNWRAA